MTIIRKNKWQLLLSSLIILLPVMAGFLLWKVLPEQVVVHWGIDGKADNWMTKGLAIFVTPLILLAIQWICVILTALDAKNKEQSSKVMNAVLWIIPITSLVTSGITYSVALGMDVNIDIAVRILLGIMFLVLGNYMPKCKQNHTIGVRVIWALHNEENWNKTHRFAGRLWVAGGVVLLATLFIPLEICVIGFIPFIIILSFAPMIYSYMYYKKQLLEGTATKEEGKVAAPEKKIVAVSMIFGILVIAFVLFVLFAGKYEVQFSESSFTINASFWNDATVNYADIEQIAYREHDDANAAGNRTFGYGTPSLLMGEFKNEEFRAYTRYTYTSCDSCIVLTVNGKTLVLNGKDKAQTESMYNELLKRVP